MSYPSRNEVDQQVNPRSPSLWTALHTAPWTVRLIAASYAINLVIGLGALATGLVLLEGRSELLTGPGRDSIFDRSLSAAVLGFSFYIPALFFVADFVRAPKARTRWLLLGFTGAWVAVSLWLGQRTGGLDAFALVYRVIVPITLAALWFLPSVGTYLRAQQQDRVGS